MSIEKSTAVPVWTLSTGEADAPLAVRADALTPERLSDLRSALAAFSETPLVTLEAHPLSSRRDRRAGLPLDAASPLAQHLSNLISDSAGKIPAVTQVAESGEVLYRMVVPAKVAAQVGKGLVKPMASKVAATGIHGTLVDAGSKLISAQATFVPVEAAGVAGAGGAVVGTVTAGTALTVAAPLVLMAVAVGATAYADQQRQKAIEHITDLLEQLNDDALEAERSELAGCRDAIDKATALLLDQGKVGASLGLDSAVHAINKATDRAERRVQKWEAALDAISRRRVELEDLKPFAGISEDGGEFRTHLEMAALAIALKRRVIVLQGVEAGQSDPANPFEHFVRSLTADQVRVDELEGRIAGVLRRLAGLELRPPKGFVDRVMTRGQVKDLLEASYRIRALADDVERASLDGDVVIEIEKYEDGTLLVLPAYAS